MTRKGLSIVEVLVILLILFILAIILLPALEVYRYKGGRSHRPLCANNLKNLGLVLHLYANEHGGLYPPIDETKNNFMFDANCLYPEYLRDARILACPADPETDPSTNFRLTSDHSRDGMSKGEIHPDCITDMSYGYLGWMLMDDSDATAFFEAYNKMARADFDKDVIVPGEDGAAPAVVLHRLSIGVEPFLMTDINTIVIGEETAASVIPVMWDQISTDVTEFHHVPAGQNVLYLDGYVDFHRYDINSDFFPVSPMCAALFGGSPRAPIPDCEETAN